VKLSGSVVATPGISSASWEKLRPFRGIPLMVVSETTSPTTAFCVCKMGATPVTSTVCSKPVCIVMSTRAFWPDSSVMALVSLIWNPSAWARILYAPIGRAVMV
jgi:hypothetical protein